MLYYSGFISLTPSIRTFSRSVAVLTSSSGLLAVVSDAPCNRLRTSTTLLDAILSYRIDDRHRIPCEYSDSGNLSRSNVSILTTLYRFLAFLHAQRRPFGNIRGCWPSLGRMLHTRWSSDMACVSSGHLQELAEYGETPRTTAHSQRRPSLTHPALLHNAAVIAISVKAHLRPPPRRSKSGNLCVMSFQRPLESLRQT
ncbi:hypothetical protein B0H10DRAFT_2208607 [Mycena sp. CBHHK59/15]|nr:hypothetical protein B0H10DRAFT_2208607 [Mycena sp. CBHHK59/15]